MSYFTETLEETMSMLEFKGDAEHYYNVRRSEEHLSGMHHRDAKRAKEDLDYERASSVGKGRVHDAKSYNSYTGWRAKGNEIETKGEINRSNKHRVMKRAASKESADPVYSDLVAIGAID